MCQVSPSAVYSQIFTLRNTKRRDISTFSCLRVGDLQVEIVHQLHHFGLLDNFFPQISDRDIDAVECQCFELIVAFEFVMYERHAVWCIRKRESTNYTTVRLSETSGVAVRKMLFGQYCKLS